MRIGFIGAGRMAAVLGKHLVDAGHEIVVSNTRGPATLGEFVAALGPRATAGTKAQVLECEIVIPAVNWAQAPQALAGVQWKGQILLDAINAHAVTPPDVTAEGVAKSIAALNGRISSVVIAQLAPGTRVVKSLNTVPMAWIGDVSAGRPGMVQFVSGDDQAAKEIVKSLLDSLGFAPVDLGSLAVGGALCQIGGPLSGLHLRLMKRVRAETPQPS